MLKKLSDGSMAVSGREIIASVARARIAVQKSRSTVAPVVTMVRLTCGVYAAMALILLSCGVMMVLLGRALAAEASEPATAVGNRQAAGL